MFGADYTIMNKDGHTPWTLTLKTYQSTCLFNKEKEKNMILYTLHAIGAEGPSDLTPTARNFEWVPPVTEKSTIHKRCRTLFDDFLDKGAMNVETKKNGVRILSLDGGGIRGLVLIKILECMENFAGCKVTSMFDWIVGTSTGGILSLALAVGKTPLECQGIYFKLKDEVFVGKRPYDVCLLYTSDAADE